MPFSAGYISDSQDSEGSFLPSVHNSPRQQTCQDSSSPSKRAVDNSEPIPNDLLADELILAVSSTRVNFPKPDGIFEIQQQEAFSPQISSPAGVIADPSQVNSSSPLTPVSQLSSGEKSPKLLLGTDTNNHLLSNLAEEHHELEPPTQAILSPPSDLNMSNDYAPERRFRPRTAAQLNPYLYERRRYEALMKIRGIRPVRVATHDPTEHLPKEPPTQNSDNITSSSRKRVKVAHTYGHNTRVQENSIADTHVQENTPDRHPRRIPDLSSQGSSNNADLFANIPIELDRDSDTDYGVDDNQLSPSSQQSNQTQEAELELYRKRIRGVLPATFLTIEQASKKQRQRNAHHRQILRQGPGIARKKLAQAPMESDLAHLRQRLQVNDDDDDQDQDDATDKRNERNGNAQFRIFSEDDNDDSSSGDSVEAIEKEVFDRMLCRISRQKRLDFRSTKPKPTRRHSEHPKHRKRRILKPNYNEAGIGDAVKSYRLENPSARKVPSFMKVASRTAKRRIDKGRASPTGKVFHFSDESDSDLQTTLREWREGTAQPVILARNSLVERSSRATGHQRSTSRGNHLKRPKATDTRSAPSTMRPPLAPRRVLGTARPLFGVPMRKNIEYRQAQIETLSGKYATTATNLGRSLVRRRRQTRLDDVLENHRLRGFGTPVPDLDTSQIVPLNSKDDLARYGPVFHQGNTNYTRKKPMVTQRRQIRHSNTLPKFQDINHTRLSSRHNSSNEATQQVSIRQFFFPVQAFTTTFNIFPLNSSIHFNETFFLGRGHLHQVLEGDLQQQNIIKMIPPELKELDEIISHGSESKIVAEIKQQVDSCLDLLSQTLDEEEQQQQDNTLSMAALDLSYEFFIYLNQFLSSAKFRSMDPTNIRSIIALLKSQTVKASDIMSTSKAQERLSDLTRDNFARVSYQSMFFLILALFQCFRFVNSRKDRFSDCLELDQEISTLGKFFASCLLRYDLDNLQDHLRNARRYSESGLSRHSNCYILEFWVCSIQLFSKWTWTSEKLHSFWEIFNEVLGLNDTKTMIEATYEKVEQIWSYIFSICPLYMYNDIGRLKTSLVTSASRSNWKAVRICMKRLVASFDPSDKENQNSFASYFHAQLGRCLNLITVWKWTPDKEVLLDILQFFASNMLENFSSETEGDRFPDFLTDPDHRIELSPSNTSFHVFLKILCLWFQEFKHDTIACKEMVLKLNRAVALNGRSYPATMALKMADIDALTNHYSLLITLFFVVRRENRPTIRQIRDVIMIGTSHIRARIVSAKAWNHMMLLVGPDENLISECMEWYNDLLHGALSDYSKFIFNSHKKEYQDDKFWYDKLISDCLGMLETKISRATMINEYNKLKLILPLLCPAATSEVFLHASFSSDHLRVSLRIVDEYINVVRMVCGKQSQDNQFAEGNNGTKNGNEDSADSFSSSLMSEFLALEANEVRASGLRTAAQHLAKVMPPACLTQMFSLIFRSDEKAFSDQQCYQVILFYSTTAQFLVENGVYEWLFYLEGGGAWRWLPDTTRKFKFEPLWLKQLLEHHPRLLATERSFFICYLLRCLAIPKTQGYYEGQFVQAMLSKGKDDVLFRRASSLAGDIMDKPSLDGHILPHKMDYQRRLDIISTILSNMDVQLSEVNDSEFVFTGSVNRPAAELIGVYGYYVHTLTMSMKRNYQTTADKMSAQEWTEYLDFLRTIIKFIVRHCPLFIDKTGVSWFQNSSNFPLGLNKAFDYEQQFRGLLRKDAKVHSVQDDIAKLFFHVLDMSFSQNDAELFLSSVSSAYERKMDLADLQIDTIACQNLNLLSHRHFLFTSIIPRFFYHCWDHQMTGGWLHLSRVVGLLVRVLENTDYTSREWDLLNDLLPLSLETIRLFLLSYKSSDMEYWRAPMEDTVSGIYEFLALIIKRNLQYTRSGHELDVQIARVLFMAELELRYPYQNCELDTESLVNSSTNLISNPYPNDPLFSRDCSEYWEPATVYDYTSLYVHCRRKGLHLATDRNVTVPVGHMLSVRRYETLLGLVKLCFHEPDYRSAIDSFLSTLIDFFEGDNYKQVNGNPRLLKEMRACIQCFLLDIGRSDIGQIKLQDEGELYI